jgi:2-desacetyl-2-hydroxyethyl bacteriochlorophyllide A dehydrogenase
VTAPSRADDPSASATPRSVWFPSAGQVELRDEQLRSPGPDEVEVEALASAISHGTEMLVFRGQVPEGLELDLPTLEGAFSFPIKYGYASVGRVVAAGAEVGALNVGDVVFVLHPHQSRYVVSAAMTVQLPVGLPPEHGVFLANVETALNVVLDAAPRLGERVAVFGQGVVGMLIAQLLRRTGASEVVVVEPLEARRALARQLGTVTALPPGEPFGDVDLAIEVSGAPGALDQALRSVAFGGTVVVASWYGTKPVPLLLGGPFHRRRLRIVSSQVGTIDAALQPRWSHARRLALARDLLSSLELAPLISHRFPIERAADAYALVDQHPSEVTQVIFTYA